MKKCFINLIKLTTKYFIIVSIYISLYIVSKVWRVTT